MYQSKGNEFPAFMRWW